MNLLQDSNRLLREEKDRRAQQLKLAEAKVVCVCLLTQPVTLIFTKTIDFDQIEFCNLNLSYYLCAFGAQVSCYHLPTNL